MRERHATYYLDLAARAEPALTGPQQWMWLDRIEQEHDNIRVALRWLIDRGEGSRALRLGGHLGYGWWMRGRVSEARGWYEEALALDGSDDGPERVAPLAWTALLAQGQGDNTLAESVARDALALARAHGDHHSEVTAIFVVALAAAARNDLREAVAIGREALAPAEACGDPWVTGNVLLLLGMVESVDEPAIAIAALRESLDPFRAVGGPHEIIVACAALGDALGRVGRDDEARDALREGLELAAKGADPISATWIGLLALAFLAERGLADDVLPAIRRLRAYVTAIGRPLTQVTEAAYRRTEAIAATPTAAEAEVTSATFADPIEGVHLARSLLDAPAPAPEAAGRRRSERGLLSRREIEVLTLVAEGRSNRSIAQALVVSENTVKYHVASLLNKLDANTRAEAVAHAAALGVLTAANAKASAGVRSPGGGASPPHG